MKRFSVLLFFLIITLTVFSQQEKIVEKVEVEYWVIPIFAVDSSGKSVLDLQESDIRLTVDKRAIENFTLLRRSFSVSEQTQVIDKTPQPAAPEPKLLPKRTKNVFLLFDTALSTAESTELSRVIAREIITKAEKNTRFFILTIEPFAGLAYAGGQTNDKKKLIDIIDKKVKGKPNSRIPSASDIMKSGDGKYSKFDNEDLEFLKSQSSKHYKRKSHNFVKSFESLYYALNAIKDNKFVYLFSEGISNAVQESEPGDRSVYRKQLTQVASYLGRSGAVLFIINPFGTASVSNAMVSGEDSLRFLAQKSGGKYLEGQDQTIIEKIDNIHQAYYEIFFPAAPKSQKGVLNISIQPKRTGIDIHTLQAAEKNRTYAQMEDLEREIMALNLMSGNPLYKFGVSSEKAVIDNESKKKNKVAYQVRIPDRMTGKKLDLYKIWVNSNAASTRVEKESIQSARRKMEITFKEVKPGEEAYFVLIDGAQSAALVHGTEVEQEQVHQLTLPQEPEEWTSWESVKKEKEPSPTRNRENAELAQLLNGAAGYCEKLKKAAFHYICKEKIVETQKPLKKSQGLERDVSSNLDNPALMRPLDYIDRPKIQIDTIRKHLFNYRLIKMGQQVKEERDLLIDEKQENPKEEQVLSTPDAIKGIRFLSSKSVFGPITLLAADRQEKYHYRLLGYKELKGRRTAIIEAFPRGEEDAQFVYGKIWLDTEDFSVLKIEANPNSILGYQRLREFSKQIYSRVTLSLETDFFKYRDGIRFPTRVRFEECYKGGPLITGQRGSGGWTRTLTTTEYAEYMFFNVELDVTYEK